MAHWELRRSVLPLVLLATVVLGATGYGHRSVPPSSSSSEGQQIGKILSVRKVLEDRYFVSRYPRIHYYLLYFAVRTSNQTYCAEYETPVLDEIDDLFSAKDKDVEFVLKGKSLTLRTPKGRKFKAQLVEQSSVNRVEARIWLASACCPDLALVFLFAARVRTQDRGGLRPRNKASRSSADTKVVAWLHDVFFFCSLLGFSPAMVCMLSEPETVLAAPCLRVCYRSLLLDNRHFAAFTLA